MFLIFFIKCVFNVFYFFVMNFFNLRAHLRQCKFLYSDAVFDEEMKSSLVMIRCSSGQFNLLCH